MVLVSSPHTAAFAANQFPKNEGLSMHNDFTLFWRLYLNGKVVDF
jgi:hypothetical protein